MSFPASASSSPDERSSAGSTRLPSTRHQKKQAKKLGKLLEHIEKLQKNRITVKPERDHWLTSQIPTEQQLTSQIQGGTASITQTSSQAISFDSRHKSPTNPQAKQPSYPSYLPRHQFQNVSHHTSPVPAYLPHSHSLPPHHQHGYQSHTVNHVAWDSLQAQSSYHQSFPYPQAHPPAYPQAASFSYFPQQPPPSRSYRYPPEQGQNHPPISPQAFQNVLNPHQLPTSMLPSACPASDQHGNRAGVEVSTSIPTLLVLNFSGWTSSLGELLTTEYNIIEPDAVSEDIKFVQWILKDRNLTIPLKEPRPDYRHPRVESEPDVDAVVILCGDSLTVFQELVVGTAFLKGKPVVVHADGASEETCKEASQWTAGTWPVLNDSHSLLEYLQSELPQKIHLRRSIHSDITSRLQKHRKVNLTGVAVTRGAVALIPFGVTAVNTISLLKLCHQCMVDTGMGSDKMTKSFMMKEASKAGAMEAVCNSASDVYQVAVQGTILAEMFSASSVSAALATLDAGDVFLLGSIGVVTGAVAAYTAYKTRPHLVDSICDTLVMLQFTYLVNPLLRRSSSP